MVEERVLKKGKCLGIRPCRPGLDWCLFKSLAKKRD